MPPGRWEAMGWCNLLIEGHELGFVANTDTLTREWLLPL